MKAHIHKTIKIFSALAVCFFWATAAVLALSQSGPSASASPQSKSRIRRAAASPPTKATPQPSPAAEPTPAATPSPGPTPKEAAATSAAEEIDESLAEEKPNPPKLNANPTPEIRLREQLKVVEQMVAQGLKQEALAELHLLAAEDRFDPQGFYNIANAFARLDASDAAINAYRKAITQRKGNYSRAANNLGVILLRQGFWDQAYEAFLSALRTESFRYAEASYNLGRLYAARGEMDRAFREWRRAIAVDPNHIAAALALKSVPSLPSLPSLSRATPKSSPAPTGVKPERVAARSGNAPPARKPSMPAFTLDAATHELLQRARTAHENGRYLEALDGFRRVIARQGGYFSPANLELCYSLMELRRNDEAIAALLLVAQKDATRFPITYYHLGRLYELRGDLQQAEENYLRATQEHRVENAQFLLNLSSVREKRGDFAGALAALENYLKRQAQQGHKPEWSDARLASLRAKVAQVPPKQ